MSTSKSNFKAASLAKCYDAFSKNKVKKEKYVPEPVSASCVATVVEKIEATGSHEVPPQSTPPIAINSDPVTPHGANHPSPIAAAVSDQSQEVDDLTGQSALGNSQSSKDSELGASAVSCVDELSAFEKKNFAVSLIDPDQLWDNFFSVFIENATQAVTDNVDEVQAQLEHSLEVRQAVRRGEHRFAEVLDFPLKLIFTPLKHGRRAANAFASMLEMQFGPLHAALQVGKIMLEWDDSSLVTPYLCAFEDQVMEMDMQPHSRWVKYTEQHHSAMRKSAEQLNYPDQIEFIYAVTNEKMKLIDALIQVVIKYNKHYYYNLFSRNCQHFVCDALEALQVEIPKEIPGGLGQYYKDLVEGRTPSVPAKFKSHSDLDKYVASKLRDGVLASMPQHDLEYLLTLYFRFHLESKTQLRKDCKALEGWKCQERNCCMGSIEKLIQVESMKLHKFSTIS